MSLKGKGRKQKESNKKAKGREYGEVRVPRDREQK
jgi:hypothetical protein